jgi:hypothetical protein
MGLSVNTSIQKEQRLLTIDELESNVIYRSTRGTGYLYFISRSYADYKKSILIGVHDSSRYYPILVDHRITTREFFEAPEGTSINLTN